MRRGKRATELFREVIAEADAGAGVIEADFPAAPETRTEDFELVGRGGVFKTQDFASNEEVSRARKRGRLGNLRYSRLEACATRKAFENPADGEVLFSAEVDASIKK